MSRVYYPTRSSLRFLANRIKNSTLSFALKLLDQVPHQIRIQSLHYYCMARSRKGIYYEVPSILSANYTHNTWLREWKPFMQYHWAGRELPNTNGSYEVSPKIEHCFGNKGMWHQIKKGLGLYNIDRDQNQSGTGLSCSGSQYFRRLSFAVRPHLSILDESLRRFSRDSATTLDFLLTSKFRSSITIVTFPIAGT